MYQRVPLLHEREIPRRAVDVIGKPITFQGRITGGYKDWSDNPPMFCAKQLHPEYRDNYQPLVTTPNAVTQINIHLHPDAKRPEPRE